MVLGFLFVFVSLVFCTFCVRFFLYFAFFYNAGFFLQHYIQEIGWKERFSEMTYFVSSGGVARKNLNSVTQSICCGFVVQQFTTNLQEIEVTEFESKLGVWDKVPEESAVISRDTRIPYNKVHMMDQLGLFSSFNRTPVCDGQTPGHNIPPHYSYELHMRDAWQKFDYILAINDRDRVKRVTKICSFNYRYATS